MEDKPTAEEKELVEIIEQYHIGCSLHRDCNSDCSLCCAKDLLKFGYRKANKARLDRPELEVELDKIIPPWRDKKVRQKWIARIISLFPDPGAIRRQVAEEIAGIADFTVRLEGNTVIVDIHDWDRLQQVLQSLKSRLGGGE